MIITVGSIRGAPGATSWSLLLAAAWPTDFGARRVMLEADPSGGVVGARYGLGVEPGAVRLVTGIRRNEAHAIDLEGVGRQIDPDLFVVPGPESGEQSRSVWKDAVASVGARLARDRRLWFVDVGRLDTSNPSGLFAYHSALVVLVVGPRQEDLVQLPSRVEWLAQRCPSVGVIVSGRCAFDPAEIREFCGAKAVWTVAARGDLVDNVGVMLAGSRSRFYTLWHSALDIAAGASRLVPALVPAGSAMTA